jgi:hypothetical protein
MTALISVSTCFGLTVLAIAALPLMGCDDDNPVAPSGPQTMFMITIQNVSTPGTLATDRAMGAIPLSPGAYAVFTETDPAFTIGGRADVGTERIAEDGFPGPPLPLGTKSTLLAAARRVTASGVFQSPGGPDNGRRSFPARAPRSRFLPRLRRGFKSRRCSCSRTTGSMPSVVEGWRSSQETHLSVAT